KAQPGGLQRAAEFRTRAAGDVGEVAGEVAAAHAATEIVVAETAAVAAQRGGEPAAGGVGRSVGQRHAEDGVKLRHAGTSQPQAQVQRAQLQRVGQRADQTDVG